MNSRLVADWRLLAFGFLMMFSSSPGQTFIISLYGGEIRAAFGLSHGEFGGIYAAGTVGSAAALMWTGRLVDRVNLVRLSLAMVCGLALACWFISGVVGVVTLTIGIFLLRQCGQGLMSHTSATTMVRYFVGVRGKATAAASIGFAAAEAVLPAITIALIASAGWRDAWRITGVVLLLLMVPAILYLLRDHAGRHQRYLKTLPGTDGSGDRTSVQRQWTREEVLRDPRFYLAMPAFLAPAYFITGFLFHQVHLVEAKGWDLAWWGQRFAVYAVVSLISTLVSGQLVDRLGATRLMPWFSLPVALGMTCLAVSSLPAAGTVFLALAGMTSGWSFAVSGPFWAENYGVQHLGAIKALATALMVFASALGPVVMGLLIDASFSVEGIAAASAGYAALVCVLAGFAYRQASLR